MGLFDKFKKNRNKVDDAKDFLPKYLYSDEEIDVLDKFISDIIGKYDNVLHEIVSPDIHLDVCMVLPTDDEPFYKLVTMGAGAYKMAIPDKWKNLQLEHAEYIIWLPKDWNLNSSDDADYWPIKLLKDVARLPIWCDTWLSYGHTTQADEEGTPYASSTRFNSVLLDYAENCQGDVRLRMHSGKTINFYQVIPLYPEELKFKLENGAGALFDKFQEKGIECKVVDVNRRSAVD